MGLQCSAGRLGLTLEDETKKTILLIDVVRRNESSKDTKREEKMRKYEQLCSYLRQRREGNKANVLPLKNEFLGGEITEHKETI